jgi:hypothetical protein
MDCRPILPLDLQLQSGETCVFFVWIWIWRAITSVHLPGDVAGHGSPR